MAHCNGVSTAAVSKVTTAKNATLTTGGHNLNGLIYMAYARHYYASCSQLIEESLAGGYDLDYPYYVKGLITREEGNPADAIECFQRAAEINSRNVDYYREIGKTLIAMGRLKAALEIFLRAEATLQLKVTDWEVQYNIAKLLSQNVLHGKLARADAKGYFAKAIQGGKHVESMHELAEIYRREGDLRKSLELFENSLQMENEDVDTLTKVGIMHLMMGESQTAFTTLLDALAFAQSSPKLLLALGGILQARGDVDGALNKYRSIENLEDQGAEVWSNLGLCFYKNQKLIAAISCLRKSIWLSPLNFNGLFNLGYVFLKAKLFMSAFHVFAMALNMKPNHFECYMLIGVCLYALEDMEGARVAFEKSTMFPESLKCPLVNLNYAIFCYQTERCQQSLSHLNAFMRQIEENNVAVRGSKEQMLAAKKLMKLLQLTKVLERNDEVATKREEEASVGIMSNDPVNTDFSRDDADDDIIESNQNLDISPASTPSHDEEADNLSTNQAVFTVAADVEANRNDN